MEIKKIMVPTDGSEFSVIAMDYALEIAKLRNSSITAVYVVDRNPGIAAPDIELCDIVNESVKTEAAAAFIVLEKRAKDANVEFETKILVGDPGEAIINATKDFDLVVMATVGKSGIKKALMGSVSQKVISKADCPVLVVRTAKD